ncbi:hypothetical protein CEXT_566891, partial [Caerostris extrusa]
KKMLHHPVRNLSREGPSIWCMLSRSSCENSSMVSRRLLFEEMLGVFVTRLQPRFPKAKLSHLTYWFSGKKELILNKIQR